MIVTHPLCGEGEIGGEVTKNRPLGGQYVKSFVKDFSKK
jgi:hypothetical protein